jgi:hypothetical protein
VLERHELLEDKRAAAEIIPGRFDFAGGLDNPLALAVVTLTEGLEDGRQAEPLDRSAQRG